MENKTNTQLMKELKELRKRNQELEKIASDYQAILNNNQLSFILIDPDFRIRALNDLAQKNAHLIFGKEMVPGNSILDFVREADQKCFQTHFKRALTGEVVTFEKNLKKLDDEEEFWFEHSYFPVVAEEGTITGICFSSLNISEHKRANNKHLESEQKFATLFELSPDAILLADANTGLIVDANSAAAKLFEKPIREIRGMHQNNLHPPDESGRSRKTFAYRVPDPDVDAPPVEIDILTAKNKRKSVEIHGREIPIKGKLFILGNFRDITERKLAEKTLIASETRFRQILENSFSGAYSRNLITDTYDYISPSFKQLTGYEPEELSQMPIDVYLDHIHPEDQGKAAEIVRISEKADKNPYYVEYRFRHRDKNYRWFADLFDVKLDKQGFPLYRYGSVRDITVQKENEAQIRTSELKFKSIIHKSPMGIALADTRGYLLECNQALADMIGYEREELNGKSFELFTHPEDLEREWELINQMYKTQTTEYRIEKRYIQKNGTIIWVAVVASLIKDQSNKIEFGFAFIQDITNRKKTEVALESQKRQLNQVIATTPNAIAVKDQDGRFILVNQATAELHQSTVEEMIGKREIDFIVKKLKRNEIETFLKDDLEVIKTGKAKSIYSEPFTQPDGTVKYFKTQKVPFELLNQEKAVLVVATDITELVEYENRLHESEFLLKEAQKIARVGHWVWDLAKQELTWSDEIFNIFGYTRENFEVSTRNFEKTIHPDDFDEFIRQREAALSGNNELSIFHRIVRPDGEIRHVHETARIIRDQANKPVKVFGTVQDITEQRNLEEQLRQSQKMEAIGKLAGGIAHDFNNLLTVINGYTDILLSDMASNQPEYEDLQQIKRAGTRAASLTNQLLAFSRKQVLRLEILNLTELLNNLEQMLKRLIGEDIELITYLEKNLAEVKADRGQIEQIIINLAVNARDAMPQGGKLIIQTQNVVLDQDAAKIHENTKPGPHILISVTDNGIGMDHRTREHIFEPFFTTKDIGKGTGLGLSTVYGIVKQSGGNVDVHSEPGKGTTFSIYLPAIEKTGVRQEQKAQKYQNLAGTETILVVEDEKSVLNLVEKTLKKRGYHIITATDGARAIETIKNYKKPIHLLLSDVVMPNISGKELSEKIGAFHPETKVLFMTGYTNDTIIRQGTLDAGIHFIQKPFSPELLAKQVREILDEK